MLEADAKTRSWPLVTIALVVTLCAAFGAQLTIAASPDVSTLIHLGATSRWLVASGEWFRVATSVGLHAGWEHFIGNLLLIGIFGTVAETRWGSRATAIASMMSGLGGMALASVSTDMVSHGSSTIAVGLIAAVVVWADRQTWTFRLAIASLPILLVLEAVDPTVREVVSESPIWGHGGGLACGAAVAGAWMWSSSHRHRRVVGWLRASALPVLLGISASLLLWGAMVLPNYEERTWVEAGSDILRDPERSFGIAQVLAETIVEAPWASPAVLAEAEQAVRRAAVGDPDEPSYRDLTSVFVEHRGDLEGAVVLRRDAYRRQPTRWRANHLIRVELLLLERRGEPARFDLPTGRPPSGDAEVWVEIESGLVEGCDVHLTAVIGELAFGFLRIRGVTGTDRTLRFALADDERLLQAQWVETSRECGAADLGDLLVEFWIL